MPTPRPRRDSAPDGFPWSKYCGSILEGVASQNAAAVVQICSMAVPFGSAPSNPSNANLVITPMSISDSLCPVFIDGPCASPFQ